ncbi:MAG TPA: rod shape-determining protein MreD [Patescibacteria group bacterium]
MYKNILTFFIIFFAVLLQISFFPNLIPSPVFPDVALVIILFWTVERGFEEMWKWAIVAGLLSDLAYFWPVGISVFSFVFVAYAVNSLVKRFSVTQAGFRFVILLAFVILGTFLNNTLVVVALKFSRQEASNLNLLLFNWDILLKILYNIAIFFLLYVPLSRLEKKFFSFDSRLKSLS